MNLLQNGKYFVKKLLNETDLDCTYKAIDLIKNRPVAIAQFKLGLMANNLCASNEKALLNRARKLSLYDLPNIIHCQDFFVENGRLYIVMEYLIGDSIDRIILPNNFLSETTAINYIRQIAVNLKPLHHIGLFHSDIRPENLILQENNRQIILTGWFKQRKLINNKCHAGFPADAYLPIENHLPQANLTPATDIYGLAATLYTMVTGQIPVSSYLRNRIPLSSPKELRSDLSSKISIAIMQGMIVEPEYRPQNIDEWLDLLPKINSNKPKITQKKYQNKWLDLSPKINRCKRDVSQKTWELALNKYSQKIAIYCHDPVAYNNRGVIYSKLKKWDLALADYTQAIALAPNLANIYYNRANVYYYQKKWQLALEDYNKALEFQPNNPKLYKNRGMVFLELKKRQKANDDLRKAAELFIKQKDATERQEVNNQLSEIDKPTFTLLK